MEISLVVAIALCLLVGLSLGLLGGGGSVLMVPLFVYVAKIPVNEAIAMSLIIVGLSSAVGVVKYLQQGSVNQRLVALFVFPGILAAFVGARCAALVSSEHLLVMFGGMMMLIAYLLFKKSTSQGSADGPLVCRPSLWLSMVVGAVIGFLTGLLGVGGGFLIVPAIALLLRCSFSTAIGTSLAIIALNSVAGFLGHLGQMHLNVPLSAAFLSSTMIGAVVGARLSDKFSSGILQRTFAVLIFLVGGYVVAQNINLGYGG